MAIIACVRVWIEYPQRMYKQNKATMAHEPVFMALANVA